MREMNDQLFLVRSLPYSQLALYRCVAAAFILFALTARPQQAALADSPQYYEPPQELNLQWRDKPYEEPSSTVELRWDGQMLHYKVTRPASVKALDSDQRSIKPDKKSWKEFWIALDEHQVWQWAKDYGTKPPSANASSWSVSIKNRSKAVKSSGTNVYPNYSGVVSEPIDSPAMLNRFWYAVDRLLGRAIEVNGTYFAAFEASLFSPSSEEFKGQRWWLTSTKEFNEQYQKLSDNDKRGVHFGGPEVFARLRGRLVGPGHYGHLNQYTHEFIVEEVLKMKLAK